MLSKAFILRIVKLLRSLGRDINLYGTTALCQFKKSPWGKKAFENIVEKGENASNHMKNKFYVLRNISKSCVCNCF